VRFAQKSDFSFTPGFSPVINDREMTKNRFNGFSLLTGKFLS
jgi:hypothetical protein